MLRIDGWSIVVFAFGFLRDVWRRHVSACHALGHTHWDHVTAGLAIGAAAFPMLIAPHGSCRRLGAVVVKKRVAGCHQFPLVSGGGFACCHPEQGASGSSLWAQAVVGSRLRLKIMRRVAASLGSGRPTQLLRFAEGEPPNKSCAIA